MSTSSINNLSSSIQSILNPALQADSSTIQPAGIDPSSYIQRPDSSRLSPFAQLLSRLQQLQQSDPAKYQQVTQQIATNLQNAAATAQADGNTTAAKQLNQLAADFTTASQSGQLPNIQDLAKAAARGHHHHHHAHAAAQDPDATTPSSTSSPASAATGTSANPTSLFEQALAAFTSNSTENSALDPQAIILNTLSSAGIAGSNG